MKKSARVSEKLVSSGLPGLQIAARLTDTADGIVRRFANVIDVGI